MNSISKNGHPMPETPRIDFVSRGFCYVLPRNGSELRALFINPPGTRRAYLETNVSVGTPVLPSLGLAAIAAPVIEAGFGAAVLDLDLVDIAGKPVDETLEKAVLEFKPTHAGITSITHTWNDALDISKKIKQLKPYITVVCGGVHCSLFPGETLDSGAVDFVALGESDFTMKELMASGGAGTPGLAYRSDSCIAFTPPRPQFESLDNLPFPAWQLFSRDGYKMSRLTERRTPGGYIETSRGCPFNCVYCNKSTFGRKFRAKSPGRVLEEIDFMIQAQGFREIHIVDDGFSTDLARAKEICRLIINSGLKFEFNLFNGIRADRLDDELCGLLRRAGCWQVAFGVESGSEHVLEKVSKGLTKGQIRRAVALCKKHGIETFGFFMIALPGDTRETILETIDFAIELDMTISKYDIAAPLPGTKMFEEYDAAGLVKTRDWRKYVFHRTDTPLFDHPSLSWEEIEELYRLAFRKTYLRAGYIIKRFIHGLKTGGLWYDVVYFLKSRWR